MPRTKDPVKNPAERLAKSIKNPKFTAAPIDWTKCPPELRALEADRATTLGPDICDRPDDAVIRTAFTAWKLDPRNPWHWRVVLYYLADAHFPRGPKWAPLEYYKLRIRSDEYPGTDMEKVRGLQKDHRDDYGSLGDERSLCRVLRKARKLFP
jgi:hypothetical protein